MKVKMLEKVIHEGAVFEADEIRVVPDNVGKYFCDNGWAEDTEGKVATGERQLTPKRVVAADITMFTRQGE